jgi:hypothetical protein
VVWRHVLLPPACVVLYRGESVPEIHVAVCFGERSVAVDSYRKEVRGGEDLVEQLLAPGLDAGIAPPSLMSRARLKRRLLIPCSPRVHWRL